MSPYNLDGLAVECATSIVTEAAGDADSAQALDSLATRVLGILQEDGLYAGVLCLLSRTSVDERCLANTVLTRFLGLCQQFPFSWSVPVSEAPAEEKLRFFADHACAQLSTLLLLKQVYEQALVYVRYGAKARKQELLARAQAQESDV